MDTKPLVQKMRWEFFDAGGVFSDVDRNQWVRRDGALLGMVRRLPMGKWESWKGDENHGVTKRGWYNTRQEAAESLWDPTAPDIAVNCPTCGRGL